MFKSLQTQGIRADENMDSFYSKRGKKTYLKNCIMFLNAKNKWSLIHNVVCEQNLM
jgi:hypothetical protein